MKCSIVTTRQEVLDNLPAAITSLLSDIAQKYKVSIDVKAQSEMPMFFTTNCEDDFGDDDAEC